MIRQIHVIRVLLVLLCSTPSLSEAALKSLTEENPVYRQVQAVYERLLPAFGDGRLPPRLMVIPKGVKTREPVASSGGGNESTLAFEASTGILSEGYIAVEERTVELLSDLGTERENALAFLLAHELAHVYLRHGWTGDFGNAFAWTDMGRKMMKVAAYEDVVKRETEADFFGGFYGYLAGYDTLGVAPKVLDRIYAEYKLPDQIPNYPSKSERIAIAQRQKESVRKLLPVYEAANRLLILARYEEAARLFYHLAQIFPSREMFSNAGVAYAQEAVRLLPVGAPAYLYPFELDTETRLVQQEQTGRQTPRQAPVDDNSTHRNRLLLHAHEAFELAGRRDKRYATAKVNSAAVQSLLGHQEEAIRLAGLALSLARETGERVTAAHALVVKGIALALNGDNKRAAAEFAAAHPVAPELVERNLATLEKRISKAPTMPAAELTGPPEKIAGFTPNDVLSAAKDTVAFSLTSAESGQPTLNIFLRNGSDWEFMTVETAGRRIGTVSTVPEYQGISSHGIRIGSPLASLGQLYGNPDRVVPSRQGQHYIYNQPGIAFSINGEGKVTGWFLFTQR
ncbi:MAG: M48 family metalloprotease [Pedobacter sp.]